MREARVTATRRRRGTYAKGEQRRDRLLVAAAELLRTASLDEVSLKDIAQHAEIPVGSAYHFFANAQDVYVGLAQRFMSSLYERIAQPYSVEEARTWQTLFETAVDRAARLYEEHPAYRQLIIGGKAPPEIKLADRAHDELVGRLMIEIIQRHFELEEFEGCNEVFFFTTEIVDLMFSLSVIRDGEITARMLAEAKRAGRAYLSDYLPEQLTPRR